MSALYDSKITSLKQINRGKVRDLYEIDDEHLLIVTTDRISAFDKILPTPIPGKGKILSDMAQFWFEHSHHILPNHINCQLSLEEILTPEEIKHLDGRGIITKKYTPLPIEAIVRGYLVGSGWKEYQENQSVCGIALPAGLKQAEKLPEPIFTPSTKAEVGDHDENISFEKMEELIGGELANKVKNLSLELYQQAASYALERGIIIADTKFEFGTDEAGNVYLIDEALTPDSSRFWPAASYATGSNPPSYDKQYIRDYLTSLNWDDSQPMPELPQEVVEKTLEKYREAQKLLTTPA